MDFSKNTQANVEIPKANPVVFLIIRKIHIIKSNHSVFWIFSDIKPIHIILVFFTPFYSIPFDFHISLGFCCYFFFVRFPLGIEITLPLKCQIFYMHWSIICDFNTHIAVWANRRRILMYVAMDSI